MLTLKQIVTFNELRCVVPFSSWSIGQTHRVIRDTVSGLRDIGLKPEVSYF